MFLQLRKGLRTIDFYQAVPTDYTEGTVSGACISLISISLLILLALFSLLKFMQPRIDSDLIIDQKHLAEKLLVNIDISFKYFPCSLLSLDIQNDLKVHEVNIGGSIQKYSLPENQIYNDEGMSGAQKEERAKKDFREHKGCRMKGTFNIDRVPGNFHFSSHGYGDIFGKVMAEGISSDPHI